MGKKGRIVWEHKEDTLNSFLLLKDGEPMYSLVRADANEAAVNNTDKDRRIVEFLVKALNEGNPRIYWHRGERKHRCIPGRKT